MTGRGKGEEGEGEGEGRGGEGRVVHTTTQLILRVKKFSGESDLWRNEPTCPTQTHAPTRTYTHTTHTHKTHTPVLQTHLSHNVSSGVRLVDREGVGLPVKGRRVVVDVQHRDGHLADLAAQPLGGLVFPGVHLPTDSESPCIKAL